MAHQLHDINWIGNFVRSVHSLARPLLLYTLFPQMIGNPSPVNAWTRALQIHVLSSQARAQPAEVQMTSDETVKTVADSRIVSVHKVKPQDCDDTFLSTGALLRWMDASACMSAERHSRLPSVTVSMDDLVLEPWGVPIGHYIEVVAAVNNAFKTRYSSALFDRNETCIHICFLLFHSMEIGITVRAQDPRSGSWRSVCTAFFNFVAIVDGKASPVGPIQAVSIEERHAFAIAAERKELRLKKLTLLAKVTAEQFTARSPRASSGHGSVNPCSETVTEVGMPALSLSLSLVHSM